MFAMLTKKKTVGKMQSKTWQKSYKVLNTQSINHKLPSTSYSFDYFLEHEVFCVKITHTHSLMPNVVI